MEKQQVLDTVKTIIEQKSLSNQDTTIVTKITYELSEKTNSLIIIEYIKVLIWPIIVLVIVFFFRERLLRLIDRIINESEELNSSLLGITAKFRREIAEVEKFDKNSKIKINEIIQRNINDEFKLLSSYFFTRSLEVRRKTADEVSKLSENMDINSLLGFAISSSPGEKVAGYIGITTHLKLFPSLSKQQKVIDIIQLGLDDELSRVRYRVIQAISSSDYLTDMFRDKLIELYQKETNEPIKRLLKNILR